MIKIKNLSFKFPSDSFSIDIKLLDINSGLAVAIYGPSGTGKSTFLKLISGELLSDSGEIEVLDSKLSSLSKKQLREFRLENYGIISQTANLIEWMSVKDNILLPFQFKKHKSEVLDRLKELLDKFQLSNFENKIVKNLSIGEQFRVSIIRALLLKPGIILADEPTASFDSALRDMAVKTLIEESEKIGATLILVTHEEEVLKNFSYQLSSESWELKS